MSTPPLSGGDGGEFGSNSPPPGNGRGGPSPPLNSPPYRGGLFRLKGGTGGGPVNFKVLEDSDDSPPYRGGLREGVGGGPLVRSVLSVADTRLAK